MTALPAPIEASLEALSIERLDAVLAIELAAHAHPWARGHFLDSLACGYACQVLVAGEAVLGYFVAMLGVQEVHLLNITVAPQYQRQGWAQVMLDALGIWARGQGAQWLWLEARVGNQRALRVYEAHGFRRVALRKDYYPGPGGQREDAIVMNLPLASL